jgi:hypothetical protein
MTIKRNRGGFRLLSPLVFALLSAIPAKSTFAGSGTIDPSNFAPGQDVSNATPGVVLSTLTLVPSSNPNVLNAVLSPVYANGNLFSPSLTSSDWGSSGAPFDPTMNCLKTCFGASGFAGGTFLEVSFATPVDSVSVVEYQNMLNPTGLQAFDSAGNLLGSCVFFGQPSSCYTALNTSSPSNGEPGGEFTFSSSGADAISYILATSYDSAPSQIGEVTYLPLPEPFWMLLVGLGGLGCCLLAARGDHDGHPEITS